VTLRELIQDIDVEKLLARCIQRTKFERESLQDALYGVIAKLLSQGSKYDNSFPNAMALEGYIQTAAIRNVIRLSKKKQQHYETNHEGEPKDPGANPEEQVVRHLELQSMRELVQRVMEQHQAPRGIHKEIRQLLELLLSSDEFFQVRQTGQSKGIVVFDIGKLSKKLRWSRYQVSHRLQHLQKAFLKENKKQ